MKERKVGYSSQDRGEGIKTKKLDQIRSNLWKECATIKGLYDSSRLTPLKQYQVKFWITSTNCAVWPVPYVCAQPYHLSLVVAPYWRAPKRAKQLSMATMPLCFEFFRCCVDVLQSYFSHSTISIAVFSLQNLMYHLRRQWQRWTAVSPLFGFITAYDGIAVESMRGEPAYQRPFTAEESAKHIFGQTAELVRVLQWRYWYSYTDSLLWLKGVIYVEDFTLTDFAYMTVYLFLSRCAKIIKYSQKNG